MSKEIDDNLAELLDSIYGWCYNIKISTNDDGIDDTATIIQELIEKYIHEHSTSHVNEILESEEEYELRRWRKF